MEQEATEATEVISTLLALFAPAETETFWLRPALLNGLPPLQAELASGRREPADRTPGSGERSGQTQPERPGNHQGNIQSESGG